jgi:hypothetical protein
MQAHKYWNFEDEPHMTKRRINGLSYRIKAARIKQELRQFTSY